MCHGLHLHRDYEDLSCHSAHPHAYDHDDDVGAPDYNVTQHGRDQSALPSGSGGSVAAPATHVERFHSQEYAQDSVTVFGAPLGAARMRPCSIQCSHDAADLRRLATSPCAHFRMVLQLP